MKKLTDITIKKQGDIRRLSFHFDDDSRIEQTFITNQTTNMHVADYLQQAVKQIYMPDVNDETKG